MSKIKLTPDDIIATLQHTNVPTLISEGKGDVIVFRRIEDRFSEFGLTVLAADGRANVLDVFDRRDELPSDGLFLFFVDQDCWIYGNFPDDRIHKNLFYTDGYSIENDMYRDGELDKLLTEAERIAFEAELERFLIWYSVALERHLLDDTFPLAISPTQFLDSGLTVEDFLGLGCGEACPGPAIDSLVKNYAKILRGKSLIGLITRQLCAKKREAKYSHYALLELGAIRSGEFFNRIVDWVATRIAVDASA